jgi:hypothetical protein
MAAIPQPEAGTVSAIYGAYEAKRAREPARGYLGASNVGHACDRYLWLGFRWAETEAFDGRMLRLFDQGQRAEARFVDELRMIGATVHEVDERGEQFSVQACGGHFSGHMDGAALGIPEAPKTWHCLEFKTHNAKSFKALQAKGVREAKPMHWAQCQVYMHLGGLTRALYLAENKDTAELYSERIHLDQEAAEAFVARAERIVRATTPPLRLSDDPDYFECRWCPYKQICHATDAPAVSCRTCTHSTPVMDGDAGAWRCERYGADIPLDAQRAGCGDHRYIPVLLEKFASPADADPAGNTVTYTTPQGSFVNGAPGFSSAEIRAAQDKRALTAIPELQQWREQYGAVLVG